MTDPRLPENVREIILAIAEKAGDEGSALAEQIDVATVAFDENVLTWLYFEVPEGARRLAWKDGVIPMHLNATVLDASGEPTGLIYVWVEDGLLSAIEHPWYVDYPTGWPVPERLVWDLE